MKQYVKIITGYIAQKYVKQGKRFVCVAQNFIAKGRISREDGAGNPISIDSGKKEVVFPLEMKQPK